jgi:hypothetical protein
VSPGAFFYGSEHVLAHGWPTSLSGVRSIVGQNQEAQSMTITYEQFARGFCADLGCPANESQQLDTLVTVFTLEDSKATYNPADTMEPEPGTTDFNPQGVKNYPTLEEGFAALKATLLNGEYPEIVAMLKAGDDASRVLSCEEWNVYAGVPITRDYAEVLAAVRNDRAAYYGRSIGEGTGPPPSPPSPVEPTPTPTSKESTLGKIVVATGDTAVYLVGGVPVVKQHINNELTQFLLSVGYEIQRDVDTAGLALVPLKTEAVVVPVAAPELVPPQVVAPVPAGEDPDPLTGGNPA